MIEFVIGLALFLWLLAVGAAVCDYLDRREAADARRRNTTWRVR